MTRISRRKMIAGTAASTVFGGAVIGGAVLGGATGASVAAAPPKEIDLKSRLTAFDFGETTTHGLVSLADNAPPPVLHLRQGTQAVLNYTNGLEDYSTLHWHGIRLPKAMDGVPYLTQFPVAQGESFRYAFTPPPGPGMLSRMSARFSRWNKAGPTF